MIRSIVEVVAGAGAVAGAVIAQTACTVATDGIGAAHCFMATYPAGAAGAALAFDGVRRIAKKD